MHKHKD